MENTQVIDKVMREMRDIIKIESFDYDCIQQQLKNDMDSSPKMYNLIADIKRDLNKITANLEEFEKCVFDVLSTQQSKVKLTSS